MTTLEKLAGITAQHNEIVKRVVNGALDVEQVREALQAIIEKREPLALIAALPSWYVSPGAQLEKAHRLWPDAVLPEPPAHFVPQTQTEVLLLHVPDAFNSLWDKVVGPAGYTKYRWEGVKSGKRDLRLAPNVPLRTEPVWLGFDPEHGKGKSSDLFWGGSTLAASEILSALIQFPDWPLMWFNGASAPNLAGYQLKYDGKWFHVPGFDRDDTDRQLKLRAFWSAFASDGGASPIVREL